MKTFLTAERLALAEIRKLRNAANEAGDQALVSAYNEILDVYNNARDND